MENAETKSSYGRSRRKASGSKRAGSATKKITATRKSKKNETFILSVLSQIRKTVDSASLRPLALANTALKWVEGSSRKVLSHFRK